MHAHLAVLGSPISHSRSPDIHRAAYEVLGLDWTYEAIECTESAFESFLASRTEEWRGFSVTMPLKVEAHRLSRVVDPVATESGVVNTLLRVAESSAGPNWAGFNTDVSGLASALHETHMDTAHTVIFGSGATAVSAVLAARSLGAERVSVIARNAESAKALADRFHDSGEQHMRCESLTFQQLLQSPIPGVTAVVSTLPETAAAGVDLPTQLAAVPLFDAAYDPWPSSLAQRWEALGGEAHSGVGMLVHQALLQIRIFVNGDPQIRLDREKEMLDAMRRTGVGR
jgi:shikimate dehydrogenase